MFIIGTIVASLIGYLIGSISFSIILVWMIANQDVREFGSKNAGATNASRILGKKLAMGIVLLDGFKVIISALIAGCLSFINHEAFSSTSMIIPALFALIGHVFPIYYKFKGGKAVSSLIGLIIVANGLVFLIFAIIWWSLIFIFRKVSLSSIMAAIGTLIVVWIPQLYNMDSSAFEPLWNGQEDFDLMYLDGLDFSYMNKIYKMTDDYIYMDSLFTIAISTTIGAVILILKHHQNIRRLLNGSEPTIFNYKTKEDKEIKEKLKKETKTLIKND